jgi:hypothetical protein
MLHAIVCTYVDINIKIHTYTMISPVVRFFMLLYVDMYTSLYIHIYIKFDFTLGQFLQAITKMAIVGPKPKTLNLNPRPLVRSLMLSHTFSNLRALAYILHHNTKPKL